jgi:very-short-patch-repair endonuclease
VLCYHLLRSAADASRDRKLQRLGWRVLQLTTKLVLLDIELVTTLIRKHLNSQ